MNSFLKQVKSFCQENNLINPGDKILLAVSGGPDSTALLYAMFALKNVFSIKITVAHLEHGLRGESSLGDQLFVKKIAENLEVDFYSKNVNVIDARKSGESIEEACRRVRYHFFFDTLQRFGFDKIATGHTLDDNIETIIYRFLSGTGPSGIAGIHPKNACIIHPLLGCKKEEIVDYLKREKLDSRTDETNIDTAIIRNKIRLEIVPRLKSVNANFKSHILNLGNIIKNENEFLTNLTESIISSMVVKEAEDIIIIKYDKFFSLHKAIKRRIVILLVKKLTDSDSFIKKNYVSFKTVDNISINDIIGNKILYCNDLFMIKKEYDNLIFQKSVVKPVNKKYLYNVNSIKEITIEEIEKKVVFSIEENISFFELNKLYFDFDKLVFPLTIRNRKDGDRIRLLNLGTKKLKTIFINDRVPGEQRQTVPIVAAKNEIIGIFSSFYGKKNRTAENYMIASQTRRVLVCELVDNIDLHTRRN